jgi:DNA-binding LytR/AlgR family response regulator
MAVMRAIIADDEPLLRAELREGLARWWPELQIAEEVGDGRAALAGVTRHRPDVVFLDVHMPRLDGISAAQQLRVQGYAGEIVFVTAYDQYAVQAFAQRAIDYLVKPLEEVRLRDTIARLQSRGAASPVAGAAVDAVALLKELQHTIMQAMAPTTGRAAPTLANGPAPMPWVRVVSGNQIQLVAFEDIACFRAVPGYTQVTTRAGEHLISETLTKLLERLDPQVFVQVHRAAIVNLRFVAKIHRERPGRFVIELKHGLGKVEASRARAEVFRDL